MFVRKLSIKARQANADRVAIDIGHREPAGFRAEANQSRCPPADRSPDPAIVDQAEALKRREAVNDDRPPETGVALDVEPGRCLAAAHQGQNGREALTLGLDGTHPFGRGRA